MFGSHYIHKRSHTRQLTLLETVFERIMYTVALLSPLALLPQIIEIFSSQDVSGLSLLSWSLLTSINILWILYALVRKIIPLLIANLLFCTLNFAGVIGILLYS